MSLTPVTNNPFARYISTPLMAKLAISSRTAVTVSVVALGILAACVVIPLVRYFMHKNVKPLATDKQVSDDQKPSLAATNTQFTGKPNAALQEALRFLTLNGFEFKRLKNHMSQKLLNEVTELHLEQTAVTPQQLIDLAQLIPNAKKLKLNDCGVTHEHLQQIKEFKKLEDLDVTRIHNRKSPSLQDKDLEVLGHLLQLKSVSVSGNDALTGAFFSFLPAHITFLAVTNCNIDDNSIKNLAHLKLTMLALSRNKGITGKTLDSLAKTPTMILLNGTSIDQDAIGTLKKFPSLTRIALPESFKDKELGLSDKITITWYK
ncbi:MAG: hypothetical protein LLF94_01055 [Chlamydiales bacterium]|nr:hypothetical protein [Chlamydiales bacterium]